MSIIFQTFGEGKPLLIIHGLFGTSDNLKAVAKQLSDSHKVYLLDAPGNGESASLPKLSSNTIALTVVDFIKEQNLTLVSILGHSLGGKIAMEIALIAPEIIDKLLVADIAPVQYTRRHDDIIASLKAVPLQGLTGRQEADEILAKKIPEKGVRGFLLKSLVKDNTADAAWTWRFDLDQLAKDYDELIKANSTGHFDGPTLMIIGSESNYVQNEHRPAIVERFPNVKAKIISGAGHWLHAERQTAFVKICRDFLSQ